MHGYAAQSCTDVMIVYQLTYYACISGVEQKRKRDKKEEKNLEITEKYVLH